MMIVMMMMMMMMMMIMMLITNIKKIIEDYKNKIKHNEIEKQINKIKYAIKIYKKNQKAFKNIPDIKNRINKNKKLAKMLKKFLDERKILILHGLMIQNYLIKLTMMLLIDIVKRKIQLNYYLFKTF